MTVLIYQTLDLELPLIKYSMYYYIIVEFVFFQVESSAVAITNYLYLFCIVLLIISQLTFFSGFKLLNDCV